MKTAALILFWFCASSHAQLAMLAQQYVAPSGGWTGPTNAYAWYNAQGVTNQGSLVTIWPDSSGSGRHLYYSTRAPYFTNNFINTNSAMVWLYNLQAGTAFTNSFGSALSAPMTMICVICITNNRLGDSLLWDGIDSGNRARALLQATVPNNLRITAGTLLAGPGTGSFLANYTPMVLTVCYNGASSYVRTNGADYVSGNAGSGSINGITLGDSYSIGDSSVIWGAFLEFIIYSGSPAATDRNWVENGLKGKYGL